MHMGLLLLLAFLELMAFPLMGAGTQTGDTFPNFNTVEGWFFCMLTSGIVLTLSVINELWRQSGGLYNVDQTLKVMVEGLEKAIDDEILALNLVFWDKKENLANPNEILALNQDGNAFFFVPF
jgi:hypothetical protein